MRIARHYSASQGELQILVYAPGSNGMATPTRTIIGNTTGLEGFTQNVIRGLAVDSSGKLYVFSGLIKGALVNPGSSVFAPTANGDVAPTNVITITNLGGYTMGQIALDSAGNIYVAASILSHSHLRLQLNWNCAAPPALLSVPTQ